MAHAVRKHTLKERLPDLLIESCFIVIALLLALYIEEYRETQQRLELADNAKRIIIAELEGNILILDQKKTEHQELLEATKNFVKEETDEQGMLAEFSFNYSMALISNAAWNSAKMSQVVQYFELKDLSSLSQTYQLQELFIESQDKLIDKVMEIGELKKAEMLQHGEGIIFRLEILIHVNENLSRGFKSTIESLVNSGEL